MLPRPLLLQRRVFSQLTLPSSLATKSLARNYARTLYLSNTPRSGLTPSFLPCRHFSVASVCRNIVAGATTSTSSTSTTTSERAGAQENQSAAAEDDSDDVYNKIYVGPLGSTFRRLKIFSLASLSLSTTLAPFIFVIESNLPPAARLALASIAITTSATSTGLVAWTGKPYVTELKYIRPEENGGAEGMEMTTMSLFMKPRITKVYDPSFLVETRRPFSKWELAQKVILPKEECERQVTPGQEETIAETRDKDGNPLGRWVVTWGENGEGTCRELGNVVRFFNVHEELLP